MEARIAELEAENAQLRELLSQEETGRLVAARFDGGIVTVQDAAAAYDSQAYYYEMLGLDPDEYDAIIKDEVLRSLVEDAILVLKAQELGVYEPSDAEEEEIRRSAQQSLDEMIDYYLPYQADPDLSDEENRAAVEQYLAGEGTTLESLMESQRVQAWRDRLYQAATADFFLLRRGYARILRAGLRPPRRWNTPPICRITKAIASTAQAFCGIPRATGASNGC